MDTSNAARASNLKYDFRRFSPPGLVAPHLHGDEALALLEDGEAVAVLVPLEACALAAAVERNLGMLLALTIEDVDNAVLAADCKKEALRAQRGRRAVTWVVNA